MANPKGKFGKSRTRKRRANFKAVLPVLGRCPQCHAPKPPHRVCAECGYYDGRKVIVVAADEAKKGKGAAAGGAAQVGGRAAGKSARRKVEAKKARKGGRVAKPRDAGRVEAGAAKAE